MSSSETTTVKPVLSVRVEQELIDRIDKVVAETGVNRADVIDRALKVGIKDQENFVRDLKGAVSGPLLQLLLNEKFLAVMEMFCALDPDPNQLKAIAKIRGRLRTKKATGRVATE